MSKTKLTFRWVRNKNKVGGDSCSLVKCSLTGILNTTIDGFRGSVGDNVWEAISIFEWKET